MSREEQIVEAGKTAAEGKEFSVLVNKQRRTMSAYEIGFIEGAEWADQHPHWIPVEERLPKHNVEDNGLITYEEVLVCLNDGCCEDTDAYDTDNKTWCKYGNEVEYWMPLPQPPVKKGGQDAR